MNKILYRDEHGRFRRWSDDERWANLGVDPAVMRDIRARFDQVVKLDQAHSAQRRADMQFIIGDQWDRG